MLAPGLAATLTRLPRLAQTRVPQPVLLTSLAWGAWHLPMVFLGEYAPGPSLWLSAVLLMAATAAFGAI